LDFKKNKPPETLVEQIKCSSLLPFIESTLRSASSIEMAKDGNFIVSVLQIIKVLASH
jgi:hypothetical protein